MTKKNTSPNAEVEPSAETEVVSGTTDRLFGEEVAPEGVSEPKAVVEGQEATAPEVVADPTEKATQYLNTEDLSGQKVKTKIDGVDGEVTFEELLKSYQTNKTISQKGQELGLQRQALADETKKFEELQAKVEGMVNQGQVAQTATPQIPGIDLEMLDETTRNALLANEAFQSSKVSALEQSIQQLATAVQPLQADQEFKKMAIILQSQNPAYNDFMSRIGEIDLAIMALPVAQQSEYTSPLGYMSLYKDIKTKEWQGVNPDNPVVPTLVPRTEGGVGVPTGVDSGDASKRATLRKEAMDASALKDIRDGVQPDPIAAWSKLC